jgi:hypothetical protein
LSTKNRHLKNLTVIGADDEERFHLHLASLGNDKQQPVITLTRHNSLLIFLREKARMPRPEARGSSPETKQKGGQMLWRVKGFQSLKSVVVTA